MWKQFFDKSFWITLLCLALYFALSIFAFHNAFAPILLLLTGIGVIALTQKKLEWGLAAAFAELFANSHGHLVSADVGGFALSLRMVIFLAVMAGYFVLLLRGKARLDVRDDRWGIFLPLFIAVAVGFIVGLSQNEALKAFKDGNAYFYLGYLLPILSIEWNPERRRLLLQVLFGSAAWVAILTLGLLYVFTHFPEPVMAAVYKFIRDTRTGELTKMVGSLFRIFLQSQISVLVAVFLLVPLAFNRLLGKRDLIKLLLLFSVASAVMLISLSRSFWVGMVFGIIALVVLCVRLLAARAAGVGRLVGMGALSGCVGALLLVLLIVFPLPYRTSNARDLSILSILFSSRAMDINDVAVSSRWKLLPEMWSEIAASPIIGSGFGEEVTFQTDDPRVRTFSPDGTWTTYSLEWGWLELWLKMGILGPIAFLAMFILFAKRLFLSRENEHAWLSIGFFGVLVMLYATHLFSPYLNHPLGLGLLLLVVPFLRKNEKQPVAEAALEKVLPQSLSAPASMATQTQSRQASFTSE